MACTTCDNDACGESTVYQQQLGYIYEKGLHTNPNVMCSEDMRTLLGRWRENRYRVVLIIYANNHVLVGALYKQQVEDDLKIHEAGTWPGTRAGTEYLVQREGSDQWDFKVSSKIEVIGAI